MCETNFPRLFRPANKVSRSVCPVCDLVYYYAINHSQQNRSIQSTAQQPSYTHSSCTSNTQPFNTRCGDMQAPQTRIDRRLKKTLRWIDVLMSDYYYQLGQLNTRTTLIYTSKQPLFKIHVKTCHVVRIVTSKASLCLSEKWKPFLILVMLFQVVHLCFLPIYEI